MKYIQKFIDNFENIVLIICMAGIALLTLTGVISRFIFHYSIAWGEEFVRYLFLWGAVFGASLAFRYNAHSGFSLIVEKFPASISNFIYICSLLITIAFFTLIIYLGWGLVSLGLESGQINHATGIPYWVVNFGLILAFAFCTYRVVELLIKAIKK